MANANDRTCAYCGHGFLGKRSGQKFCSTPCAHKGRYGSPEEQFWRKVGRTNHDACWEWTGLLGRGWYGRLAINRKNHYVHRLSWELHNGVIPSGMVVCHACDNPKCVNPQHLWLGTSADNNRDRAIKNRNKDQSGERNEMAKLTASDVQTIRLMIEGGLMQKDVAARFAVHPATISDIKYRRTWAGL